MGILKWAVAFGMLFTAMQAWSQPTCQGYPVTWGRKLTQTSYAWRLEMPIGQDVKRTDGTVIPEEVILGHIRHAVQQWLSAVNSVATIIQLTEDGSSPNVLLVSFADMEYCGETSVSATNPQIQLKLKGWYSVSGGGVDLRTTILHEMGHVFLGGGHWTSGQGWSDAVMRLVRCDTQVQEFISSCESHITFNFYNQPITVTLDQQSQDGTRLTNTAVRRWNGSSFDSITITTPPPTINTVVGARMVLRGKQDTVSNPAGKYHVWRRGNVDQFDTVQNHRGFTIAAFDNFFISRLNLVSPTITIKTDLVDVPGTTGGNIQLRDPWYIDYSDAAYGGNWRNRGMQEARLLTRSLTGQFAQGWKPDFTTTYDESPYHPYRGVFLNQSGPPQWNPPYYSVGAPNPNTIAGFEAFFVRWDDSQPTQVAFQNAAASQTGVVFKQSGATAVAKYKLHLASSTTQAISNPSQRKIIRTGPQTYFACYQSGGHIWVTRSTNGGQDWSNEIRMSDDVSGFTNRSPAISMSFLSPTRVIVAWEAAGWYLGDYQNRIYLRAIDPNAFATVEHRTIITVQAPYQFSAMPALAPSGQSSPTLLGFYDPAVPAIKGYIVDYAISATLFQSGVVSFSIAANDFGSTPQWMLAWSNGTTIYDLPHENRT